MNEQFSGTPEPSQQTSLFTHEAFPPSTRNRTTTDEAERYFCPNDYFRALDSLLMAIEELLRGDYPIDAELRRRLANPTLEALIFAEMGKSLAAQRK